MIRRLCDRCHFYENDECTNTWGCDDDFKAHISLMPKRDVEVISSDESCIELVHVDKDKSTQ